MTDPKFIRKKGTGKRKSPENLLPMTGSVPRFHNITYREHSYKDSVNRTVKAEDSKPETPSVVDLPATLKLNTTQSHYGTLGIRRYIDQPDAPHTSSGHRLSKNNRSTDIPQVYSEGGELWIHEGHHRIIASRLSGEPSIQVQYWDGDNPRSSIPCDQPEGKAHGEHVMVPNGKTVTGGVTYKLHCSRCGLWMGGAGTNDQAKIDKINSKSNLDKVEKLRSSGLI